MFLQYDDIPNKIVKIMRNKIQTHVHKNNTYVIVNVIIFTSTTSLDIPRMPIRFFYYKYFSFMSSIKPCVYLM